jgi:PadR family transcriptional regulator, regulatory protein PadR
VRRKPGALVPLEVSILSAADNLRQQGVTEFYGLQISKEIKDHQGARLLTGYGTLYRALDRLYRFGRVSRRWEDPGAAAQRNRPRRRLYQLIQTEQEIMEVK